MSHYKLVADLSSCEDKKKIHNGFVDHVEDGGWVNGAIYDENGEKRGSHTSSTLSWLEHDLLSQVNFDEEKDTYEKNW